MEKQRIQESALRPFDKTRRRAQGGQAEGKLAADSRQRAVSREVQFQVSLTVFNLGRGEVIVTEGLGVLN